MNQILIFLNATAVVYVAFWSVVSWAKHLKHYKGVELASWVDPIGFISLIWIISWILS